MTFEALAPLRLKTRTLGSVALQPGQRVTWPDEAVRQLLERVPQKIKVIYENPCLTSGKWCEWISPLFGHCSGQVVSMTVKGYIVTNHSVIGPHKKVEIPIDWVESFYSEREQKTF